MTSVLVTGANGFLGQHLCLYLQKSSFKVIAAGRGASRLPAAANVIYESVELTDKEAVAVLMVKYKPDVLIHNAAMSKPDECNDNRELCLQVNVETTRNLLTCSPGHFIYISTDFVFGENGPHAEEDQTGPLNFYGETKLMAEQLVQKYEKDFTIVRPVFIYGKIWEGLRPSFLHWVKNNLEQQKPIKVTSDQLRTPTYVEDICKGINSIINLKATGVYHLAGKDIVSPYDMAIKTAEVLGLNSTFIESVTAETFPEPVKRARRSGLIIDKAGKELDYEPVSFEEGVRKTFQIS